MPSNLQDQTSIQASFAPPLISSPHDADARFICCVNDHEGGLTSATALAAAEAELAKTLSACAGGGAVDPRRTRRADARNQWLIISLAVGATRRPALTKAPRAAHRLPSCWSGELLHAEMVHNNAGHGIGVHRRRNDVGAPPERRNIRSAWRTRVHSSIAPRCHES